MTPRSHAAIGAQRQARARAQRTPATRGWLAVPLAGSSPRWVFLFIAFEFVCQLVLLTEATAPYRAVIRSSALGASIAILLLVPDNARGQTRWFAPAFWWGFGVVAITALEILHPLTATFLGGVASAALTMAILAPLYWAPRLKIDEAVLRRIFLMYWAFNTVSAFFGLLQTAYPGRFDPAVSSEQLKLLTITLANGETVMRPMGLTDMPGGAGVGGLYATILGIGFLLNRPGRLLRLAVIGSAAVSMMVIYLCQVRILLLMVLVAAIAITAVLAIQGRFSRMLRQVVFAVVIGVAAFSVAASLGGQMTTDRMATLTEDSAGHLYYKNRGHFLVETFVDLLPAYPLGAGLGRHGMISTYFGAAAHPESNAEPIYSELNWSSWVLDGGVPLAVAYAGALIVTLLFVFRAATVRVRGELGPLASWAAVLVGYNLSVIMLTFDATPFEFTLGCDFWVLNGAFFCATLWTPFRESATAMAFIQEVKPMPRRFARGLNAAGERQFGVRRTNG